AGGAFPGAELRGRSPRRAERLLPWRIRQCGDRPRGTWGESSWEDRSWVPERATEIEFSEEQHDQADTVAGLGALELGKVPMPGAEITTAGLHLVFEGGHNKRGRYIVKSAVVSRVAPGEEHADEDNAEAVDQTGSGGAAPRRDDSAPQPAVGQNGEGD